MIPQQLLTRIEALLGQQEQVLIAIDGHCAAGKTTLAGALKGRYDCNILPIDDFFLRPEQRTPERLRETGGNVDYERFREAVLAPLCAGRAFSYAPYNCGTQRLGQPIPVPRKRLNIVEGTYSLHPYFGDVYDLRILLTVPEEVQQQRILQRPAFLHRRFFEEWIPMERQYFQGFDIASACDLIL